MQKRIDIIGSLKDSLVTQDAEMNDIVYFDINFLIERILVDKYFKITPEDLKINEVFKQITAIEKEGYTRVDAERIFNGASRKKFKKVKIASATPSSSSAGGAGSEGSDTGEESEPPEPPSA